MRAKYTLDPLVGMPAQARREHLDNAAGVLATLLGIAPDSPESDQLCQHQIDNGDLARTRAVSERCASSTTDSPHSAPMAILPPAKGATTQPRLAVQHANEWLIALSASESAG
ncbi:Uncharacterised protein [Mycobacteroides abscessus subsp. abscessus]|uniref:hypothetical protein n=1 Tax=Mycobacteroides abscessus TaxID=36809 RepID=UPI0009296DB0|nr:hypothetical protein [Mycobacteroides abscessus]SIH22154.1 Uncharacterised protein [Mycobacteroides abscessus subsp. abscessus]